MTALQAQSTDFTRDVLGRYVCNGFDEASASTRGGDSPFHYIIIGGGTFGGALASFLCNLDPSASADGDPFPRYHSRVLVLEAGPMLLPEHEQNLPGVGVGVPGRAVTLAELQPNPAQRQTPAPALNEVWGVPWHSDDGFNGLAYCIGGRSLFWGGWAPRFLPSEMPTNGQATSRWPKKVTDDLAANGEALWKFAAHQIGADDPNDFINGELHRKVRQIFFAAVKKGGQQGGVRHMIPLAELPDYLDVQKVPPADLPADLQSLRLDAPYAVQTTTRSGFFPLNKFSSAPLLIAAARKAAGESQKSVDLGQNDARRQMMVVPNCHVKRLVTLPVGADRSDIRRVVAIETNLGTLPVAHNAIVVLASAAIESARLALNSFSGVRSYGHIGKNLMVHLRTNTVFRVPRSLPIFAGFSWNQLEVSAIQLRGRIRHADATEGHFHLQIVASGVKQGGSADSEIFRKVPDLDQLRVFQETDDTEVAFAIRGIGEFSPKNPNSRVDLDPETDEFGVPRAFVRINDDLNREVPAIRNLNQKDSAVLTAMLEATNDVLSLFGLAPRPVLSEPQEGGIDESRFIKLDGVGTTYHEAGTLRFGDDPDDSVLDENQRFHGVSNAYVCDMSVLPTCGSANPMQPGIALTRRLAEHLAAPKLETVPAQGMFLFKDTPTPFWRLAGAPGRCVEFGLGTLEITSAQGPFGVYWCTIPTPPDFELSLDWLSTDPLDNSGIFIRFPDPDRPAPGRDNVLQNPGDIASLFGFEVQIDATQGGDPPRDAQGNVTEQVPARFRGTGAIYNESAQALNSVSGLAPNQWHTFIIRAQGLSITVDVRVNGGAPQRLTSFTYDPNAYAAGDPRKNPHRGLPSRAGSRPDDRSGYRYIGLQSHNQSKRVKYRNIYIKPL
jgi:choline dehydrogenase-like flavoprotein